MSLTAAELAKCADFERQYRRGLLAPTLEVERAVCGCDYGGTSWATRAEVHRIAAALALAPGIELLEIGAGSGWPGLYLAHESGCTVTLTDLPTAALEIALERAAQDGIRERCTAVAADAGALPFAAAQIDAINHSDVLCCLVEKQAVLAECRRVIRPAGRMAFSVIYIEAGLSPAEHVEAIGTAPEFAWSERSYPEMLAATGWKIRAQHDLTAAFRADCLKKLETEERLRDELVPLTESATDFDARQARMRRRLEVLDQRHMRRKLFVVMPV